MSKIEKLAKSMLLLVFVAITPISCVQTNLENSDLTTRISQYLEESERNGYSGAILIAKDGEVILSQGYGLADRENEIPITPSTVFNIGSVTKQFTAAGILILLEENKINLSDTLGVFLDHVPGDKAEISVHQLLTHTSGISTYAGGFRYDYANRDQFIEEVLATDLVAKPGSEHNYSNAGYTLLAALIEIITQKGYEEFLNEHIFEPLEMTSTGYKIPDWDEKVIAHSYFYSLADNDWVDWGTTVERWQTHEVSWYGIGKGDIQSTVEDLYKWHQAIELNSVLSEESRKLFETPYVFENSSGTSSYAYGWGVSTSNRNTKIVSHDGSNGLYFSDFIRFTEENAVVISLSNVAYQSFRSSAARREMLNGNDIDLLAREVSKMVFEPTYDPTPLPKPNSYELVFEFIEANNPEDVDKLSSYLFLKQGKGVRDSALLNRIGLYLSNDRRWEWAIALLALNVELFPSDGNLWNTLGEVYMSNGDIERAKPNLERSLELAPSGDCGWCESSRAILSRIEHL